MPMSLLAHARFAPQAELSGTRAMRSGLNPDISIHE